LSAAFGEVLYVAIVAKKNFFCRGVVTSPCNGFRRVKNSLVGPCIVSGVDSGWLEQRCDCRHKPAIVDISLLMCADVCSLHRPVNVRRSRVLCI